MSSKQYQQRGRFLSLPLLLIITLLLSCGGGGSSPNVPLVQNSSPIISGLVARNCPNFINVGPMLSSDPHNFSPGDLFRAANFFDEPIENK